MASETALYLLGLATWPPSLGEGPVSGLERSTVENAEAGEPVFSSDVRRWAMRDNDILLDQLGEYPATLTGVAGNGLALSSLSMVPVRGLRR